MDPFQTVELSSLRSQEQVNLLGEIDALSRSGIGEHISLPQIVVCGDQSSGKSSCLEAISGVPFPRKDTLCTRFATELVLRKSSEEVAIGRIIPGPKRPENQRQQLLKFRYDLAGFDELPSLIEAAKREMGLDLSSSGFCADILRVEISGPTQPHLTVVDLPGLIHGKNDDEDDEDIENVVSELVEIYMGRSRSLILAVVSAQSDRALQAILKRSKAVDPQGKRTMGLITKPDTLPPGSDSEKEFVRLVKNEITKFRLGWHVLRNRDYDMRNSSDVERNEKEEEFFSQGVWATLPRGLLGIRALRGRLSTVLLEHIRSEMPTLIDEIEKQLEDCGQALKKLGDQRKTLIQQRLYLLKHSQEFTAICRSSCEGTYDDPFFGDCIDLSQRPRRFRAIVHKLNSEFAEAIRLRGHYIDVAGTGQEGKNEAAISWVRDFLVNSKGRELPGTFNPMLIGALFRAQSAPWVAIANHHLRKVWLHAKLHLKTILSSLMGEETCSALCVHLVDPAMENALRSAQARMDDLLTDRLRHAITYNHYFTEDIQKRINTRREARMRKAIEQFFPVENTLNKSERRTGPKDITGLCATITGSTADMDTYASIELLDYLESFYKVSMKTFIDNVAIQVIEARIVHDLIAIYTPVAVEEMASELIAEIASESDESLAQRELLDRKFEILKKGMEICKRYATHNDADVEFIPKSPASQRLDLESALFEDQNPLAIEDEVRVGPQSVEVPSIDAPSIEAPGIEACSIEFPNNIGEAWSGVREDTDGWYSETQTKKPKKTKYR